MPTPFDVVMDMQTVQSGLEAVYATLLNGIDDHAIYALDARGRVLTWNVGAERVKGWSADDVLGLDVAMFYSAEEVQAGAPEADLANAERAGRSDEEGWRVRKDGSRYWAHVVTTPLRENGTLTGFARVTRDLTAQRTAASALQESERRFRRAFEHAAIGMSITAADGRWIRVNRALCIMLGYSSAEMLERDFQTLTHPDDLAASSALLYQALADQDDQYALTKRYLHKEGHVVWAKIDVTVVRAPGDADPYFLTQIVDITAERQAQQALAASEMKFRTLSVASPVGIFQSDASGSITYANPRLLRLFDLEEREGLGYGWLVRLHPDDREGVMSGWAAALAAQVEYFHEYRLLMPDGSIRWMRCHAAPLVDADGQPGTVGTVQDVTERRALEAQRHQAQKLEAIGRLAGGVAHDFNNLLTVISGNVAFARAALPADSEPWVDLAHVETAAARAAELTRQLLAFSRQQVLAPSHVDLNVSVARVSAMLTRVVGDDVVLETRLATEQCLAWVDPGQLDQVLMNLVMNARDAMPKGGTIRITTGLRVLEEKHHNIDGVLPAGRYVSLAVSDGGVGISSEALPHIFEPFYTTKDIGKGTGLGLATVYGIVVQSSGRIFAESAVGAGSTFTVLLPEAVCDTVTRTDRNAPQAMRGNAGILLVDDNAGVADVVTRMLTSAGYTVHRASNGVAALELLSAARSAAGSAASPGRLDLVLADLEMPDMGGVELVERVRAAYPRLATLLMTGYSRVEESDKSVGETTAILQKPFSMAELLQRVHRSLADRDGPSKARTSG